MRGDVTDTNMATLYEFLDRKPEASGRRALVVQGGGMRGVYSLGALCALEDAGLGNAFDVVAGSSAGAINATYFLAGQANESVRIYTHELRKGHFVNFWRPWRLVDIDFLVDVALKQLCPLDVEAVKRSPTLLEIILTDAETGKPAVVTNRDGADLYEVLRATAALPALYNRRVQVGAHRYIDGGVADAVPIQRVVDNGAHDVVAVLTRPSGFRRTRETAVYRAVGRALARGQSAAVKNLIGEEDVKFNHGMDLIEGKEKAANGLSVVAVWPSDLGHLAKRTTSSEKLLVESSEMGRRDMEKALGETYPRAELD